MEIKINVNSIKNFYVYYQYKKITNNQKNFVDRLLNELKCFFKDIFKNEDHYNDYSDENDISHILFEFPPTLDKDFLYLSTLYTLVLESKKSNNPKKIIILVNNSDKIETTFKILLDINRYNLNKIKADKNNIFKGLEIIPFYKRKMSCFNENELKKSSTYDKDMFCIKSINSFLDKKSKCEFYENVLKNNNVLNNCNFYCKTINEQLRILKYFKICGYYYCLNKIFNDEFDLIICERDLFFDAKQNISLRNILNYDDEKNKNKYLLVFDEFNDIDEYLIKIHSCIIDNNLLSYSEFQLFNLQKNNSNYNSSAKNSIISNFNINNCPPENEIINYNLFSRELKITNIEKELNGAIRSNDNFINLLLKIIEYFKDKLSCEKKQTKPKSFYEFEYDILDKYHLELKKFEQIYKRLILFLNHIKFFKYEELYHLIHFIYFLCSLAKNSQNYFVVNFISDIGNNLNREENKGGYEFTLLKPSSILEELYKDKYVLNLTGGMSGKDEIIKKLYNLNDIYKYEDDNLFSYHFKSNLFLTNNTNTTPIEEAFYGEILKMLCQKIPDGIICYIADNKTLNEYIIKWTEGKEQVFSYILNNKLIFIEENDSEKLSNIIVNYKKAIDSGRGGLFFVTYNGKFNYMDNLSGKYSRCIIFIGFPNIFPNVDKEKNLMHELKRNYNKIGIENVENESIEMDNYEIFKRFSGKIVNKIENSKDKTIMTILGSKNSKILDKNYKDFLPLWIKKILHPEKDDESNNIHEKIKLIPKFLTFEDKNI